MSTRGEDDWFTCPNCGEVVREGELACPACGADDETGWSEQAEYDDLGLDDEVFGDRPARPTRQVGATFGWIAVGLALLLFILSMLGVW